MLSALYIGNFKAFAEPQRVPIRPLTFIYGANSSGKSSILHSLILARHAMDEESLDVHRTKVGGESVDLGGFRQYVHRREPSRRVEWSAELETSDLRGAVAELLAPVRRLKVTVQIGVLLDDYGLPREDAFPQVHVYELEADGTSILRMSRRRGARLQLDRLPHQHPVFRQTIKAIIELSTTTMSLADSDYGAVGETLAELTTEITADEAPFLPKGINLPEASALSDQSILIPISKGNRGEDISRAIRLHMPRKLNVLIKGVADAVKSELLKLQYLGPLRSYPPRHIAFSQFHDPNWHAGGGYAWDVIRQNTRIRDKVNRWLGDRKKLSTPYELRILNLLTVDMLEPALAELLKEPEAALRRSIESTHADFPSALRKWKDDKAELSESIRELRGQLSYRVGSDLYDYFYNAFKKLKAQESSLADIKDVMLVDRRSNTPVSHRDVGIGISQVLPVLVAAFASRDRLHAVEQPEIHLHPALQAELGDVFIESALGGQKNRFLIETHSEHLLLRVMRRMRETAEGKLPKGFPPVKPEQVMVLYVEPEKSRSIVREMPLNARGELVKAWPGGFFEEGLREVF